MRSMIWATAVVLLASVTGSAEMAMGLETQRTFSAKNHDLDFNDNFSPDGRFLCYDTRETVGPGIEHSETIEVLELETGREIVIYRPDVIARGDAPAPGVGAVSFAFHSAEVGFIHGPPVSEAPERGAYARSNRSGGRVVLSGEIVEKDGEWRMLRDGNYAFSWLDRRDVAIDRDTLPGAHRGGTHRHEYCRAGTRIGFTYDDHLLPQYDRTLGYMEPHAAAPPPASHYFAILVPVVPKGTARPGQIEKAYGDSWVDSAGAMRAFIGKARNVDGVTYEESLYVADVPVDTQITTADAGSASRYPKPPAGTRVRRLTHTWAGGIARASPDGARIAYHAKDDNGTVQVFVISAFGADTHPDPALRPAQVTRFEEGAASGIRWHPSGEWILCVSDEGLAITRVAAGERFGESHFLTPRGDGGGRHAPVISPDGHLVAYNRVVPTFDTQGNPVKNYAGADFKQIFSVPFPDMNMPPAPTEADHAPTGE